MTPTNRDRQHPPLPTERREAAQSGRTGVWLARNIPVEKSGVVWLKRPMPQDQWPPDQSKPRDNTFSWWVRASCGHDGGTAQFAFYEEEYVDVYERVFRNNPCWWTECDGSSSSGARAHRRPAGGRGSGAARPVDRLSRLG